jgi:hypothetical protein
MPVPERKRSSSIKITLTPLMHDQLREVAESIGQTPATLASMYIGQAVAQQLRSLRAGQTAVEGLVSHMGPELVEQFKLLTSGMKE